MTVERKHHMLHLRIIKIVFTPDPVQKTVLGDGFKSSEHFFLSKNKQTNK